MCDKAVLNEIAERVCAAVRDAAGEKLEKVVLFGSYARGDYTEGSDIDFFVLVDILPEEADKIRGCIHERLGDIDLEYDVVTCLHIASSAVFHRFVSVTPFYKNVENEGIVLYAA